MLDHHLGLAGHQAHRLHIGIAPAGVLVVQVLGQAHLGLGGGKAALAFVHNRIGVNEIVSRRVALEDADADLQKLPTHAGFVEADGGELFRGTGGAAGGGGGDLAVRPREVGHGGRLAGEPVLAIVLALVGGVGDHPGAVKTGAAVETVFAGQVDLGRDDAVGDVLVGQVVQGAGGDGASRLGAGAILGIDHHATHEDHG